MVLFIIFIKSAKFTNLTDFINHLFLLFYQAFSGHFCRLGNSHNLQDGWSDISQNTVIQSLSLFVGHPNARHRIQRMSRIRRADLHCHKRGRTIFKTCSRVVFALGKYCADQPRNPFRYLLALINLDSGCGNPFLSLANQ